MSGSIELPTTISSPGVEIASKPANRILYFKDGLTVSENTSVTPPRIEVSGAGITTDITTLTATVTSHTGTLATHTAQIAALGIQDTALADLITALAARVTALEAKRFTATSMKTANYTAAVWEHVITNSAFGGSMTVTLPTSPAVNDRVRVTDVSSIGNPETLTIAGTFYVPSGGTYYPTSPYVVADDGGGASLAGASIELLYVAEGWLIVSETCKPELVI